MVACSLFVATVKTSAPVSPHNNSYNAITAVSVDLPDFLGMNSITSDTMRLDVSFLSLNPYTAQIKNIWKGSNSIGSPAKEPFVCFRVSAKFKTCCANLSSNTHFQSLFSY